ncbi:MAG: SPOUT family RNA methylase [Candidatus Bathyarchaeota archaeon]|nr:SPOUT family RNA methylase [Candidatus Bathyarchaeota archaeon]
MNLKTDELDFSKASVIVKTLRRYERVTAQILRENFPEAKVLAEPLSFSGLVLVWSNLPSDDLAREIEAKVPEAERVLPVKCYAPAEIESIMDAARKVIDHIRSAKSFAVNTVRRGRHSFSSIDVNIKVGSALKDASGCPVNLDFPDKVVFVEIIGPHAYIGVADGRIFLKKMRPGKFQVREYFRKVSLVQMPYLGGLDASHEMGVRIGREAQTFEVGELVIAPIGSVRADELNAFIKGIFEGIESRYQIQAKTYAHKPHKTEVYVQNLYELVRERAKEPIIVFEPEGEPISSVSLDLAEKVIKSSRVNFLVGSREGIPHGVFRFASLVVDLCPGVTIATDMAAASALTALAFAVHQKLSGGVNEAED